MAHFRCGGVHCCCTVPGRITGVPVHPPMQYDRSMEHPQTFDWWRAGFAGVLRDSYSSHGSSALGCEEDPKKAPAVYAHYTGVPLVAR